MFNTIITWILAHTRSESGQDLIEYAALGGLIAAAIVAVLLSGILSTALDTLFTNLGDCIDFSSGTPCLGGI